MHNAAGGHGTANSNSGLVLSLPDEICQQPVTPVRKDDEVVLKINVYALSMFCRSVNI